MATLMTSPDESRLAIVDLTGEEYKTITQALWAALGEARQGNRSADEHAIRLLLSALDD